MNRAIVGVVIVGSGAACAAAQSVASLRMLADGQPSVTVAPGVPVQIQARLSWTLGPGTAGGTNNIFAAIRGDMVVAGDAGSPASFFSQFTSGSLVNLGSFIGGSRRGIDIAATHPSFGFGGGFIPPPLGNSGGLVVGQYDLVLSEPGEYALLWVPHPERPLFRVYPSWQSPESAGIPTTYVPATITVTPAPASAALLAGCVLVPRRRRPSARVSTRGTRLSRSLPLQWPPSTV